MADGEVRALETAEHAAHDERAVAGHATSGQKRFTICWAIPYKGIHAPFA